MYINQHAGQSTDSTNGRFQPNEYTRYLYGWGLTIMSVNMPLRTEYRFLTHDESGGPQGWVDIFPDGNETRIFANRAELIAFADSLEAEGWELISVTTRQDGHQPADETPLETWVFRRANPR